MVENDSRAAETIQERSAWLVLAGLHLLNGTRPLSPSDPVVLVPLGSPWERTTPSNTVVLRWDSLGQVELRASAADGRAGHREPVDGAALFPGMLPGAELRRAVAATVPEQEATGGPLVPVFYLSGDGSGVHVHSQTRFLAEDACFVRVTEKPLDVRDVGDLSWLPEAVEIHARSFLFLNNHQRYYRKCFPDQELEYKYTLTPPVDVWTLTVEMYNSLLASELPDHIMEYRDEFQAWDYLNHLFEVVAPEAERGYVSFIPTTDGKHLVKRKWYAEDSFDRRESHTYGVDVRDDGGFEEYIRRNLGVEAVRLPSFRRVRYDVNFESVRTGHVYGVFFDHCSLVDDTDVVLNQCELEYLRSRTAVEPDEAAVREEMDSLALWVEEFLRARGLDDERGVYSKRTFLKDAVAARPELAKEVR